MLVAGPTDYTPPIYTYYIAGRVPPRRILRWLGLVVLHYLSVINVDPE